MKKQAKIIILTGIISGIAVPHSFGASGFDINALDAQIHQHQTDQAEKKRNQKECFKKISALHDRRWGFFSISTDKLLFGSVTAEERQKMEEELNKHNKEINDLLTQHGLTREDYCTLYVR